MRLIYVVISMPSTKSPSSSHSAIQRLPTRHQSDSKTVSRALIDKLVELGPSHVFYRLARVINRDNWGEDILLRDPTMEISTKGYVPVYNRIYSRCNQGVYLGISKWRMPLFHSSSTRVKAQKPGIEFN